MKHKILVITPVKHIQGITKSLNLLGEVKYMDDPTTDEVLTIIKDFNVIFTNPNKSKVYLGKKILDACNKLDVICTASTGTNHIDKEYAQKLNVKILSITEERNIIKKISSTAELAFALTLSSIRYIVPSYKSVMSGEWNYEKFIGRQMNFLTVGIIGFGRLGSMYANFLKPFGSKIIAYDPYKNIADKNVNQVEIIDDLLERSDVIAIHVHVTNETTNMLNKKTFDVVKEDVVIINTSRGDVINEGDLVKFLEKNSKARIATDVLSDEIRSRKNSPLLKFANNSDQVLITPHIGGMSREAQEIAYGHAVDILTKYLSVK